MRPGMTQLFSLLKIEEVDHAKTFDAVVLDMPASGRSATISVFSQACRERRSQVCQGLQASLVGLPRSSNHLPSSRHPPRMSYRVKWTCSTGSTHFPTLSITTIRPLLDWLQTLIHSASKMPSVIPVDKPLWH